MTVVANKPMQTIEQIQQKSRDLLDELKNEKLTKRERDDVVEELLNLRGGLVDRFKPVTQTIEMIESGIKKLELPEGDYGVTYPLKVVPTWKNIVSKDKVIQKLKALKLDPFKFVKLDTTATEVKNIIATCPEVTEKARDSNKHYFK